MTTTTLPTNRYTRGVIPSNPSELSAAMRTELGKVQRAQPNARTVVITADYAAAAGDQVILADTTAGNVTVTLAPAAQVLAVPLTVIKISGDAHSVIVAAGTGDTVDGGASLSWATARFGHAFVADGTTHWWSDGGPAAPAREAVAIVTAALANLATESGSIAMAFTSGNLMAITVDRACWVRLYGTQADRDNDAARALGTTAAAGIGLQAEFSLAAAGTVHASPKAPIGNDETPTARRLWYAIMNRSGALSAVTATLSIVALEP